MATPTSEKVKAFLDRFGSAGKRVLDKAEEVEKEAISLGVAFKESDTQDDIDSTEKAKKPRKPKPETLPEIDELEDEELEVKAKKPKAKAPKIEIEIEDEGDEEEDEVEMKKLAKKETPVTDSEVAVEDEFDAEAEVEAGEELEDGTDLDDLDLGDDDFELEEEEKDYEFVMGNMTLKEYGDMMAEVFVEAMAPITEELGEIRQLLGRRKEADNLMLESQLEQGEAIDALKKQFETIEATLKATRGTLASLTSEQPKSAVRQKFIASEAEETMITDDHRLKQAAPAPDPLADFTNFIVGGNLGG